MDNPVGMADVVSPQFFRLKPGRAVVTGYTIGRVYGSIVHYQ